MHMGTEWIWLLDDDVVPETSALENLLRPNGLAYSYSGEVAVLCPAVEEDGRLALRHRRYFDPSTLRERPVPNWRYAESVVEIDTASFAGFLAKADAVSRVGLPDARFFLSYDDTEFSLRLKRAGFRLWLLPASRVDHRRPPAGRLRHGPFGLKHYYNLRNRLIVYDKFGHAPTWRLWLPYAQAVLLLLIAGRGRPAAFQWYWRALRDSRTEPYVVTQPTLRDACKGLSSAQPKSADSLFGS